MSVSLLYTGVNLRLDESVLITEGGKQEICVAVSDHEQLHERERDIRVSFSVISISNASGRCNLQCMNCIYVTVIVVAAY